MSAVLKKHFLSKAYGYMTLFMARIVKAAQSYKITIKSLNSPMLAQGSVVRVKKLGVVTGRGFGIMASKMITFRDDSPLNSSSFNRSVNSGANLGLKVIIDNRLRNRNAVYKF